MEPVYQKLFCRELSRANIEDDFFPVSGAGNYSLLYLVIRCIMQLRTSNVLELGAGETTRLLHQLRGKRAEPFTITTIEHDPVWRDVVANSTGAEIVSAPLVPTKALGHEILWYDQARLPSTDSRFDLVLIDGPPANVPATRYNRIGCIELLKTRLADDFVIVFDDAERRGEAEAIAACREILRRATGKIHEGTVIARKRQHVFASGKFASAAFF